MNIPPRLTIAEIEELSCLSRSTLYAWARENKFPKKLYTTKKHGAVYNGKAVYRALGYLEDNTGDAFYDTAHG